jgi:hypothetical protein
VEVITQTTCNVYATRAMRERQALLMRKGRLNEGLRKNPYIILVERDDQIYVRGRADARDVPDDMPSRNHCRSVSIA